MFYRCFSRHEKRRQNIPPFRVCTFLCRFNNGTTPGYAPGYFYRFLVELDKEMTG